MDLLFIFALAAAVLVGVSAGALVHRRVTTKRIGDADELAKRIVEEARKEAQAQKKEILLQGQDDLFNQKRELENEFKERERDVKIRERKLDELGGRLEEKLEKATEKEHELLGTEKDLARKERQLAESEEFLQARIEEQEQRLAQIAGFTAEEAKTRLFSEIEAKTRHESARMIRQIEMEARETADRKAKEILCNVIQRYAGDYVNEQTVTAVPLPSEDMKGRIIGREGRNIRALEAATGVDLIIDDTPETVILSAYSPCLLYTSRCSTLLSKVAAKARSSFSALSRRAIFWRSAWPPQRKSNSTTTPAVEKPANSIRLTAASPVAIRLVATSELMPPMMSPTL